MRVRFLHSPSLITKYTMGDCRILASSIADRVGGTVIAIGSEGFHNYPVMQQSDDGVYFEIFNNPMHYSC